METAGKDLVQINSNLSAHSDSKFDQGVWRGAAAMRIVDVLQRMGKSVAISGCCVSQNAFTDKSHFMASVRLKAYGEPLRADRLAAMVTLGFFRIYFVSRAMDAHPTRTPTGGRGYPIDDYSLLSYAAEEDKEHGGAVVSIGQCFNKTQAQNVVDKFIAQYTKDEKVQGLSSYELTKNFTSGEAPHQ